MTAKLGFVGLGVMGGGIARRLLEAGPRGSRLQPHPREGSPPRRARARPRGEPACSCRVGGRRSQHGHERRGAPCRGGGRRRHSCRARAGEDLGRHDHGGAGREPRARRPGPRAGRGHGRCPGLGKREHARGRSSLDHGRGATRDVRASRADPEGHRPQGDPRGRQRTGAAPEDRDQPEPAGADGGLLRGALACREGRDRPRGGARRDAEQRHRLAHAEVPRPLRPRAARGSLVQRRT